MLQPLSIRVRRSASWVARWLGVDRMRASVQDRVAARSAADHG
jgi:hypothetical protein